MPPLGFFILPLGVAGDGVKCRRMSLTFIIGMPLSWLLLIAFSNVAGGIAKNV